MRAIYFDCYSGVSGDMILAALLDLGLDREDWQERLRGLAVAGYDIQFARASRHGLEAQQIQVLIREKQTHRHLRQIEDIILSSRFSEQVTSRAMAIFRCLAEAEAKVHGCPVEQVHFHEVGALDAIVDVTGACLALEMLKVEKVFCSPIGVGQGLAQAAHGMMPLPPPATLEILRGMPIHFTGVETELATPTGAAIMRTLATFSPPPENQIMLKTGYGAGSKEIPQLPNVLRAILLEGAKTSEFDRALLLETNIDDMNPEIYPYVIEGLLEAGAMDAYLVPLIMKKGRPGVLLSALCREELKDQLLDVLYGETSTLGVRILHVDRLKLPRKEIIVETEFGPIRGKEARWKDRVRRTPEFEDCKRIAREKGVDLQQVYQAFIRDANETKAEI